MFIKTLGVLPTKKNKRGQCVKNTINKYALRIHIGLTLVFYVCTLAGIITSQPVFLAIGIIPMTYFIAVMIIIHPGASDRQKILVLGALLISATIICILEMLMIAMLDSISRQN